jgi:hypothetical protein
VSTPPNRKIRAASGIATATTTTTRCKERKITIHNLF